MTAVLDTQKQLVPAENVAKLVKLETLKKEVDAQIKEIKSALLTVMEDNDIKTLKTGSYTLTRAERKSVKVVSQKEAIESLESMDIEVKTEVVLAPEMTEVIKAISLTGKTVAGVETNITPYVAVRVNKDK